MSSPSGDVNGHPQPPSGSPSQISPASHPSVPLPARPPAPMPSQIPQASSAPYGVNPGGSGVINPAGQPQRPPVGVPIPIPSQPQTPQLHQTATSLARPPAPASIVPGSVPGVPIRPPSSDPSAPGTPSSESAAYRPLNVKDALSYLDQVKTQFGDQPEVYNQFLDIMRDFKSQAIDTPGVIERVSSLFRAQPNLIIGFNTFLPPGYRIEPTNNPNDPVRVTTPGDVFYPRTLQSPPAQVPGQPPPSIPGSGLVPGQQPHPAPGSANAASIPVRPPSLTPTIPEPAKSRTPVEFNHAITYVNKIKNRFSDEPETYKQFLEILQTYQKDQRPIQAVYAQVQQLFKNAPDLLDEFKQFLPDTSQAPPVSSAKTTKKQPKKLVQQPSAQNAYPQGFPSSLPPPPARKRLKPFRQDKTSPLEELEFFEKCRRVIGNKTTYNEFLKILNLFSQEIIEARTLVERVEPFLSKSPELMEWFKRFVKYEDDVIYNIPGDKPEFDLQACRRSGHSYRRLPSHIPRSICSGRDELAKEVLNDDWFSHPVYVSETGFVSHKKTPYEEAMYRCEEERYEFDLNIEANLQVISLLEPIHRKLQGMSPEQKAAYQLPYGLGGSSECIYKRVIKKIYDSERGKEVIEALHENPSVAVPVLLKRLKQKDEEWKRAQREWNKVWREIDIKNFAKSLDHQGIVFKATDRKAMNVKGLVTEIEMLHREQREKRGPITHKYQFDFLFRKSPVFTDAYLLLNRFLEGNMAISSGDEERIKELVATFIPKFFMLEDEALASVNDVATDGEDPMVIDEPAKDGVINLRKRSSYTLYGNTNIYGFFRLYQMLFSRLLKMKELSDQMSGTVPRNESTHSVAVELGLQKERDDNMPVTKDRYHELLKIIGYFVTNEMDQSEFEERTRNLFWTSGYLVFTVDRLVQAIVKQLQLIVNDDKSMELLNLYLKDRQRTTTTPRQEAIYKHSCDSFIQDDTTFKFEFFTPERVLTIQMLTNDDKLFDDTITAEEKWSLYVDQFVQLSATEAIAFRIKEPFLRRTLPTEVEDTPPKNVTTKSGLELKICVNTYKIFFVDNTEDFFHRRRSKAAGSLLGLTQEERSTFEKPGRKRRFDTFRQWLDNEKTGWKSGLSASDIATHEQGFESWIKTGKPSSNGSISPTKSSTSVSLPSIETVSSDIESYRVIKTLNNAGLSSATMRPPSPIKTAQVPQPASPVKPASPLKPVSTTPAPNASSQPQSASASDKLPESLKELESSEITNADFDAMMSDI